MICDTPCGYVGIVCAMELAMFCSTFLCPGSLWCVCAHALCFYLFVFFSIGIGVFLLKLGGSAIVQIASWKKCVIGFNESDHFGGLTFFLSNVTYSIKLDFLTTFKIFLINVLHCLIVAVKFFWYARGWMLEFQTG